MNVEKNQLTEVELDAVVGGSLKDAVVSIVGGVVNVVSALGAAGNAIADAAEALASAREQGYGDPI
jgi:hypothetical protein